LRVDDADLLPFLVDQADLWDANAPVDAGFLVPYSSFS